MLKRSRRLFSLLRKADLERDIDAVLAGIEDEIDATGLLWSDVEGADASTWAEVMEIVNSSPVGITVSSLKSGSGSMVVEPAAQYDFKHGKFVTTYVGASGSNVEIVPGTDMKNVSMLVGTNMHFFDSTMSWDSDPGNVIVIMCMFGGSIQNDGPSPAIRIPDGASPLIIGSLLGGGLPPGASPTISVGPGGILWTVTVSSTTGMCVGDGTVVSDDNTSILIHAHTGGFVGFPNNPGFLGTQMNVPLGSDGGSGPTAARPDATLFGGTLPSGWKYYDTDIDKPIVVNAANSWVDYAGNPVLQEKP